MNECRELEPFLAAYVDGEAAAADRARVDAHVAGCRCCRDRLAAQRTVCESFREQRVRLRSCASEHLKARCARAAAASGASAAGVRPRPSLGGVRRWVPLTAAATIFLAIAAVFGLGLNDKVQALAFQATADHAKCTRFVNMSKVAVDPVAAGDAWQNRFGWPIRVPSSSAHDLELRAVRRCGVTDGLVAHVMYVWRGEPLSLFVLPSRVLEDAPAYARRFGHDSVMWSQNGRTYIMVAERRRDPGLDSVAAYVRANVY